MSTPPLDPNRRDRMNAAQIAEFVRQSKAEIVRASGLAWDRLELLLESLAEFERDRKVIVVDDGATHGAELEAARKAGRVEGYEAGMAEGLRRVRALLDQKETPP